MRTAASLRKVEVLLESRTGRAATKADLAELETDTLEVTIGIVIANAALMDAALGAIGRHLQVSAKSTRR